MDLKKSDFTIVRISSGFFPITREEHGMLLSNHKRDDYIDL